MRRWSSASLVSTSVDAWTWSNMSISGIVEEHWMRAKLEMCFSELGEAGMAQEEDDIKKGDSPS